MIFEAGQDCEEMFELGQVFDDEISQLGQVCGEVRDEEISEVGQDCEEELSVWRQVFDEEIFELGRVSVLK